MAEIEEYCEYN